MRCSQIRNNAGKPLGVSLDQNYCIAGQKKSIISRTADEGDSACDTYTSLVELGSARPSPASHKIDRTKTSTTWHAVAYGLAVANAHPCDAAGP
jgi:hypothetical protein